MKKWDSFSVFLLQRILLYIFYESGDHIHILDLVETNDYYVDFLSTSEQRRGIACTFFHWVTPGHSVQARIHMTNEIQILFSRIFVASLQACQIGRKWGRNGILGAHTWWQDESQSLRSWSLIWCPSWPAWDDEGTRYAFRTFYRYGRRVQTFHRGRQTRTQAFSWKCCFL